MGSDSFQNLPNWKNADVILSNYPIIVYLRPGFDLKGNVDAKIRVLQAPLLEISATHIRECIQKGKSIKYLVPKVVEEEIEKSSFYKKAHRK